MATNITTSAIGVNNNETVYTGTATTTLTEYAYARNQNYLRIKNNGTAKLSVIVETDGQRTINVGEEIVINAIFQSFRIKSESGSVSFTAVAENDIVLYDELGAVKAVTANLQTITENLDIAIDALKEITIHTYKTMTDALSDNTLPTNSFIETQGYYTYGDGGGGLYVTTTYNPNDGNPCYINYKTGLYARYIFSSGRANILAMGAKRDNTGDCSPIIQGFANAVQTRRNTLYFPVGIYRCTTLITITEKIDFEGATPYRSGYVYWYNGVLYSVTTSTIFFPSTANDQTFMTLNNTSNGSAKFKNLCFASDSTEWLLDGWTVRPTIPYNVYHLTDKYTGVNGINADGMIRVYMDGCCFMGWSGYGTTIRQVFDIHDTYADTCGIGFYQTSSDAMLYDCYITHCKIGIQASNGVLFAYNMFIDQCIENAIKGVPTGQGQTSLKFSGCIDHIGYAGIDLNTAYDVQVDARIGRCGMYWAGVDKEDILPRDYDTYAQASTISAKILKHGVFNLSVYLRDITDSDAVNYLMPIYLLNGTTWEKVTVLGTYPSEYDICSPLLSNITSSIGVFTHDGFHQYPMPKAPSLSGVTVADDDTSNDKTSITMPALPSGATKFLYVVSSNTSPVLTPYTGEDWTANTANTLTASQANLVTVAHGKNVGIAACDNSNLVVQFVNVVAITEAE